MTGPTEAEYCPYLLSGRSSAYFRGCVGDHGHYGARSLGVKLCGICGIRSLRGVRGI